MPEPVSDHKKTIRMASQAEKLARKEMGQYRRERNPLREQLEQIENHYRHLPKRGE